MTPLRVVGIDAGGTRVRAVLADVETGAPVGEPVLCAASASGEPPDLPLFAASGVVAVCTGIAKYTRPGVAAAWETRLAEIYPDAVVNIVPDYVIAFHAGVPNGSGIVVVAGTGSVAYGENAAIGETARVGGRGWEWGDEGSGTWLTAQMVLRTLRALDGQAPETTLTNAVCAELLTDDAAILAQTAGDRAVTVGRGFLVPLLVRLHATGAAEANGLFVGAGGWLASLAAANATRLRFSPTDPVTFARAGGVWEAGGVAVGQAFETAVLRKFPTAVFMRDAPAPVSGAVRLAAITAARKRSE